MEKLSELSLNNKPQPVRFVETLQIKEGVSCDVYTFPEDESRDLAIVTVAKGFKTPLQQILKGDRTVEGLLRGKGTLTVQIDGASKTYEFDEDHANVEVAVEVGQIMQWHANGDGDLVFYEICEPPYEDGRFKNLSED